MDRYENDNNVIPREGELWENEQILRGNQNIKRGGKDNKDNKDDKEEGEYNEDKEENKYKFVLESCIVFEKKEEIFKKKQ